MKSWTLEQCVGSDFQGSDCERIAIRLAIALGRAKLGCEKMSITFGKKHDSYRVKITVRDANIDEEPSV